jgi:hypothetical protein
MTRIQRIERMFDTLGGHDTGANINDSVPTPPAR